jgi:CelD/BcsL family acetyltransferase involved in cellulose biosynthesis
VTLVLAYSTLVVTTLDGVSAFRNLESSWRALERVAATHNPFLAWEWVQSWVENVIGDRVRTVVISDGDEVVALAPFCRRSYWLLPGVRAVALQLGGPREFQHVFEAREVLAAPRRQADVFAAMRDQLLATPGADWVEFSAAESRAAVWDDVLSDIDSRRVDASEVPMPILQLQETWPDVRTQLRRNIKESIRHSYNSLRRAGFSYTFSVAGHPAAATSCLDTFLRLHTLRSMVRDRVYHHDQFAPEQLRTFLRRAVGPLMEAGRLEFCTVDIGGETVASRICLHADGRLYLYYSGFDPAWWRFGVMTLLVTERIKLATEEGIRSVNFSPGLDQSKERWKPTNVPLRSYTVLRPGVSSGLRRRGVEARKHASGVVRRARPHIA